MGRIGVTPELKLGWARESLDHHGELTAALAGATALTGFQRFSVRGVTEARDSAVVTVGATTAFVKRSSPTMASLPAGDRSTGSARERRSAGKTARVSAG